MRTRTQINTQTQNQKQITENATIQKHQTTGIQHTIAENIARESIFESKVKATVFCYLLLIVGLRITLIFEYGCAAVFTVYMCVDLLSSSILCVCKVDPARLCLLISIAKLCFDISFLCNSIFIFANNLAIVCGPALPPILHTITFD